MIPLKRRKNVGDSSDGIQSLDKDDRVIDDKNKANPKLDLLENKEKELAMTLKSLCTPSGQEKTETLEDSADVIKSLGKIHLQRAVLEIGIDQKISFIRCAVLLHAAIQRFKIVNNAEKIQLTQNVCQEMSRHLLEFCGSCCQADLLDISENAYKKVSTKREETQRTLDTQFDRDGEDNPNFSEEQVVPEILKAVKNDERISIMDLQLLLTPDRESKERKMVEEVQEINENVTAFYKEIIRDITAKCLDIMSSPPCKFAIVGLGSLSREEVTLYSDFEHVILLENDIDEKENYQSVLEYFRWFSVVFQVIIIGFGESIIPSVAVKSLNDVYSEVPDLNWFYDNFTPKGMSFDGMLPHACNIPLGRQQETKRRHHVVELIKTPAKMAWYLTREEHLNNGYHLADVLRQTCLVYGDAEIYASFMKERDQILKNDESDDYEIYSEKILKNAQQFVCNKHYSYDFLVIDSKSVFYRPLATYVGVIARIYGLEGKSTFAIIDRLYENNILLTHTYNRLKYAFAVACEVRMKVYHSVNQQRHGAPLRDMEAMMVGGALGSCKEMMTCLKSAMDSLVMKGNMEVWTQLEELFTDAHESITLSVLLNNGYAEEAVRLGEKLRQRMDHTDELFDSTLFHCYYAAGVLNRQRRLEYFQIAESLYSKLIDQKSTLPGVMDRDLAMASCYDLLCMEEGLDKHKEWMSAYEKYFTRYFEAIGAGYDHRSFILACFKYYESISCSKLTFVEADERIKAALWEKRDDIECQILHRLHLIRRSLQDGHTNEDVREQLASLSAEVQKRSRKLQVPAHIHSTVANIQIRMWWLEDAARTLESITADSPTQFDEFDAPTVEALKLLCLCRLHGNKIPEEDGMSDEQRDEAFFRRFVASLWESLHLSAESADTAVILLWVIYLKSSGKLHDIFSIHQEMENPKNNFAKVHHFMQKFVVNYCTYIKIVLGEKEASFAMLLLAKSL